MDDMIQTIDLCYDLRTLTDAKADEVINLRTWDIVTHNGQSYRLIDIDRVYTRDGCLWVSVLVKEVSS